VVAVVGIYIAAAELLNEIRGHVVLPLGESGTSEQQRP
jgi:succinate-acetate transporter protein